MSFPALAVPADNNLVFLVHFPHECMKGPTRWLCAGLVAPSMNRVHFLARMQVVQREHDS